VRQDAPGRLQHRHPRHPKCRRGLGAAHQAQRLRARAEACAARAPLLVQTWQPRRGCQRQALRLQTRNASGAGRGHTACACSWHALLPAIPCSASHSSARREASVPVCVSWQCTGPRLVLQLCSAAHTGMVPSRMRGLACLPVRACICRVPRASSVGAAAEWSQQTHRAHARLILHLGSLPVHDQEDPTC
jgi:hypothetical protein